MLRVFVTLSKFNFSAGKNLTQHMLMIPSAISVTNSKSVISKSENVLHFIIILYRRKAIGSTYLRGAQVIYTVQGPWFLNMDDFCRVNS